MLRHISAINRGEPTINEQDRILGWRPKSGTYVCPPYARGETEINITIWPNGARATSAQRIKKDRSVLAVGCSLTQGWAISDQETFMYKLQQRFPEVEFVNLGCLGYGTLQSLLFLEDYLKRSDSFPLVVLYGFVDHHQNRNVAEIDWLLHLSRSAKRGHVYLPYCLTDKNGRMKCYYPQRYPVWLLDMSSSLISFLKDQYLKIKYSRRISHADAVTKALLVRMDTLCRTKGIKFFVTLLYVSTENKNNYVQFLNDQKIHVIDCTDARSDSWEMKVPGEGHPNERMNAIWAGCIEKKLNDDPAVREMLQGG